MGLGSEELRPQAQPGPLDSASSADPSEADADLRRRLTAARAGSGEAVGELLDACRNYLLLVANSTLGDNLQAKIAASDLVQETFLEAHQIFERFTGQSEEELLRWLTRILENKLGNAVKRFAWAAKRDVAREVRFAGEGGLADVPCADADTPSAVVAAGEQAGRLKTAIESLSTEHRQVLQLRIQEALRFEEIGRRMERSSEAARKLFARAIDQLQHRLAHDHD